MELTKFDEPFSSSDLEWRVQRALSNGKGILIPYITARAIMDRLDEVVGKENWQDSYKDIEVDGKPGCVCTLSIRCSDGHWVSKEDAAGATQVEAIKGSRSSALRRTAVKWGIGRYLYSMGEVAVELSNGKYFNGTVTPPDEFLPENERTGNNEFKVEYKGKFSNSSNNSANSANISNATPEEIEAAKNMVVEGERYNNGKKLGELYGKALSGIATYSKNPELKKAAQIVLASKGN